MLQHDRAFLVRPVDILALKELATEPDKELKLLLCKYDWRGKNHPTWSRHKLFKWQKLTDITDHAKLKALESPLVNFRSQKPLRWQSDLVVTGDLHAVLMIMFVNHAVPTTEDDALRLNIGFADPIPFEISLTTFMPAELPWNIPDDRREIPSVPSSPQCEIGLSLNPPGRSEPRVI